MTMTSAHHDPPLQAERDLSLKLLEIDEDHAKGALGNVLLMVWARRTLAAPYRRSLDHLQDLRAEHPDGVCVFKIIENTATPPENDAREAIAEFMKAPSVAQFSAVFEGAGLKAAAVRTIIYADLALSRPAFPHAVHRSVEASAAWHAKLSPNVDARALEEGMQTLRELYRTRCAG